jgi:Trypsin/Bacterial pre-peptidase C-terminal domain
VRRLSALIAALVLAAVPSRAARARHWPPRAVPRIVNGTYTSLYPSTGALLLGSDPSIAETWCSGTMIGCGTFLTAAHCVCDRSGPQCQSLDPASRLVFLQHAGFFPIASIAVPADYAYPVSDVAVLKLAVPLTGVRPSPIAQSPPTPGTMGTVVGFGRAGGTSQDYGLKRVASVTTAACTDDISDLSSVCWQFLGTGGNTCNGDSGGPLFTDAGGGPGVAGVTSGGTSDDCLADDHSYNANVAAYSGWIATQTGADLASTACGSGPQVGDPGADVASVVDTLSAGTPSRVHAFSVLSGTAELRVAMNAVDDGSDFDLYVKLGSTPTTSDYDCAASGPNQFGFCRFVSPAPGKWYAMVQRYAGQGTYQVTATTFGGTPGVCGNGAREVGEECDDTDDLACPGFCGPACSCVPECNGTDLAVLKLRTAKSLSLRATLDNAGGTHDGLDPRTAAFTLVLDTGATPVRVTIPANDAGWSRSRPERGSYRWRGDGTLAGLRHLSVKDKSSSKSYWEIRLSGRDVPGLAALDPYNARVTLAIDTACVTRAL